MFGREFLEDIFIQMQEHMYWQNGMLGKNEILIDFFSVNTSNLQKVPL